MDRCGLISCQLCFSVGEGPARIVRTHFSIEQAPSLNLRQLIRLQRRRVVTQLELAYARIATRIPEAFPDFMCIGAPRAATTWLYTELDADPRIFLPKQKELHFYDERQTSFPDDESELRWQRSFFFDVDDAASVRWYWYQFRGAVPEQLRGDITPVYSLQSRERVQCIRKHIPELRIIYIMRNPVERAWSGLRKTVWYQKGESYLADLDEEWLRKTIMRPEVLARGDYQRAIETWESVFPRSQICYLFYDDIRSNATGVLDDVYLFLGLTPRPSKSESSPSRHVNAAPNREMPEAIRVSLERYYAGQIGFLQNHFGRDLSHWLSG